MNKFILAIVFLLTISYSYGARVYYYYRGYTGKILVSASRSETDTRPGVGSDWVTMTNIGNDIWAATLPDSSWDSMNFAFGTVNNGLISFDYYKDCIYNASGPIRFTTNGFEVSMCDGYFEIISAPEGEEVTIPSHVTWSVNNVQYKVGSIGDRAFYNHNIVTLNLPPTIEIIGNSAFSGCKKLKEVSFNSNLKEIGYSAFGSCTSLSQVKFPESLITIADKAFSGCTGLKEINIPSNIVNIGNNVFNGCPIKKLEINTETIQNNFSDITSLETLIIGDETQTIGERAFYNCSNITNITLGVSLTTIGERAFYNCRDLLTITSKAPKAPTISSNTFPNYNATLKIPAPYISAYKRDLWQLFKNIEFENDNIKIIRDASLTFACDYSTRQATLIYDDSYADYSIVDIPEGISDGSITFKVTGVGAYTFSDLTNLNTVNLPSSCQEIFDNAFYNCTSLARISLPASIASIGAYSFYNCSSLREIVLPPNLTYIEDYAFYGCTSIVNLTIPRKVKIIKESAFANCEGLKELNFESPSELSIVSRNAFYKCSAIKQLILPEKLKEIGDYAFSYLTSLTKLQLPPQIELIEEGAFEDCKELEELSLPSSLKSMGNSAFGYCDHLRKLVFEQPSSLEVLPQDGFYKCKIQNLDIPSSVKTIKKQCFWDNYYLKTLKLPEYISEIEDLALQVNQLDTLTINCIHIKDWFASDIYGNYKTNLQAKCLILGDSVQTIADKAFKKADIRGKLKIPDSVKSIGNEAFYYCQLINEIEFGNNIEYVGKEAFYFLHNLSRVRFPNKSFKIDENAFDGLRDIGSMWLYIKDLKSWSEMEFISPTSNPLFYAKKYYITLWDEQTSQWNKSVTEELKISSNISKMGNYLFPGIGGIKNVIFEDSNQSIVLGELSLPQDYEYLYIGRNISGNLKNNNLKSVEIGPRVTRFSNDAFKECTNMTAVIISDIEKWCTINFGNAMSNPLYMAKNLYLGGDIITELYIPNKCSSIKPYTFYNCENLVDLIMPASIKDIGNEAFKNCTGLKGIVSYSETAPECGSNAFGGFDKKLCELWVPEQSVKKYSEADQWQDFYYINPIVFPSSIVLNSKELNLLVNDSYQLEATILPVNTTKPKITWSSSDSSVVSVSDTGKILASSVGSVTVKASCGNINEDCKINVFSLDSSSLSISSLSMEGVRDKRNLKATETLNLTAKIQPQNLDFITVEWKATPEGILDFIVPEGGNGKEAQMVIKDKVNAKNVTVTALLKEAPEISASYAFDVDDLYLGDANDNGIVTVSDVVTISDYIVHKDMRDFCFVNADVVNDMQITPADVTATVNIIMDDTPVIKQKSPKHTRKDINDYLIIDNFTSCLTTEQRIGVKLNNTKPYVAIYASFKIPEGMEVRDVTQSERSRLHMLNYNITDDNLEVILFSFTNQNFEDTDANLFDILVSVKDHCGDIEVHSVIASDAYSNEYKLQARGGQNSLQNQTSVINPDLDNYSNIYTFDSGVEIRNAENKVIRVYSLKGELLVMKNGESSIERIPLSSGIYIIIVGRNASKVIIK